MSRTFPRRRTATGRSRRRLVPAGTVAVLVAAVLTALTVTAPPASAATNPAPWGGARKNATRLSFSVSGTTSLSVDVGSGNALVTDQLLTLPGAREDVPITLSYNSSMFGSSIPSSVTGDTGSGWLLSGYDQRLILNSDGSISYIGPQGLTGVFTPAGAGAFTAPAQFQADLNGPVNNQYTLTFHRSQEKLTFSGAGRLRSDDDRNHNHTAYNYDTNGLPSKIVTSRGSSTTRTATITMTGGQLTKITQASGVLSRSVSLGYSPNGHLASVTDAINGVTSFASAYGTDTGQVVTITNPRGKNTTLAFTGGKVSTVTQTNPPIDNGAGNSTTRLAYPTTTQTLVADPTTNQSQAVSAVPHTTYDLDSTTSLRVRKATDPDGNIRSGTYTTLGDIASATPAAGGTTTYSYGANGGESLTGVATPGGATESAGYTNSGANAYLPSSTTDDANNSLTLSYDGNGNQLGTQQGAGTGPTAKVTYDSTTGVALTSASPGAPAGVVTTYAYSATNDPTHTELSSITPPSGTSLGVRDYTWDDFGRLATATDGAGNTIGYTYDDNDRITNVHYSDATADVAYTYNSLGLLTKRVDGAGTTTNRYDDLGHLLYTSNTANGQSVTYTYDLAGALASATDGAGTVSYGYDAAHQLTSMTWPQANSPECPCLTSFANDANARRTDVWFKSDAGHTSWAAHQHYSYDASGRVKTALGERGPASAPVALVNQTFCYSAGAVAPNCPATATADRGKVQWVSDSVTGETQTYTYDGSSRLKKVVVTGGSNPRTYTYGYDSAGNRTSSAVTGSSPSSQSLTFNNANQITSAGYGYDGAGNQTTNPTRTATYNAAGQQQSVHNPGTGNDATYTFAGTDQDELLTETVAGGAGYTYSYGAPDADGLPQIDSITLSGTGSGTGYVFHDPSGQPVMLQTNAGNTCLYLYDGLGNPIALSNSSNTTPVTLQYDPYGAATRTDTNGSNGAWNQNPYLFGAGVRDRTTGEVKFGQRWYGPQTGTWTQQDALNAPLDPSNANRYVYAAGDPVNNRDATGQDIFDVFQDGIDGFITGFVSGVVTGCLTTGCIASLPLALGLGVGGLAGGLVLGTLQQF